MKNTDPWHIAAMTQDERRPDCEHGMPDGSRCCECELASLRRDYGLLEEISRDEQRLLFALHNNIERYTDSRIPAGIWTISDAMRRELARYAVRYGLPSRVPMRGQDDREGSIIEEEPHA